MKKYIEKKSVQQGFKKSRLPAFSKEEIDSIKGSADFLGLNYYSTFLVQNVEEPMETLGYESDAQVKLHQDENWPSSGAPWLKVNQTFWIFRLIATDENLKTLHLGYQNLSFLKIGCIC